MAGRTPASARPIRQSGAQVKAATARAAEALHLLLPETLLQHPFRKDAKVRTGEGRAATGMEMPADVGVMDSLTDYPVVVTARKQEFVHVGKLVRPTAHLSLHSPRLQPAPEPV